MTSRAVLEAMVRGFIKGGSLKLAWKLLVVARKSKRMFEQVMPLLDKLGEREEPNLSQQDCIAIMKVYTKMGKSDVVESLFGWFRQSGRDPSIVMFATVIHSRYKERRYREAFVWRWRLQIVSWTFQLIVWQ